MERDMLEQLYREHYRAAWLYVLSLCRDPTLAEDLVADAFVKAYLSFPEAHTGFRFWLLRVCRNLWLDHLRREAHRESDPPELHTDRTPEQVILERERQETLYRCIGELPRRDRELLTLFYFSGLSVREIAAMVGGSEGAVRTGLCRARGRLQKRMEEEGYGIS